MGDWKRQRMGESGASKRSIAGPVAGLSFIARARDTWTRVNRVPAVGRSIRAALMLAESLRNEPITLRASALTYLTLLSLVPLLAVVFSVFQAVVGTAELQQQLQEFILQNLAVGARENFSTYIEQYVKRATGAALGGVGFVFLLGSAVSLMANIESAFNHTFHVPRQRPLAVRIGVYWSLLTLGPLALSLSIAGTALLQSSNTLAFLGGAREVLLWGLPFLVTYLGFTLLYLVVPATHVRFSAALIGAFVAGTLWEAAKIGYTWVSAVSVRKDAIYGSLSAIPVFLLWAYLSWILVLFGARVAYAAQTSFAPLSADLLMRPVGRELIAARVLREIVQAFHDGKRPPELRDLADALQASEPQVHDAIERLHAAKLVRELADGGWQPAMPASQIRLADVYRAVHGATGEPESLEPGLAELVRHWRACDEAVDAALSATYEELIQRSDKPADIHVAQS